MIHKLILKNHLKNENEEFIITGFPNKEGKCISCDKEEKKIVITLKNKKDEEFGYCLPCYITEFGELKKGINSIVNKESFNKIHEKVKEIKDNYKLSPYLSLLYNYYFAQN